MSENVQDDDQKNNPTDNGESDGGESPVVIEEAESTQPSPESGQGSPHSPDSTMVEGGAQACSSTGKKLPPGSLAKKNPMLVNVLTGKYDSTTSSNSAEASSSSSSRQEVPDSPSRRKRESDAPAPEPPFSPTKKLKSPKKKDKSPNKDDKK